MEQPADFNHDLPLGKKGENDFYQLYKDEFKLTKIDGKNEDFIIHGIYKMELKSEQRHFGETGNIYIETVRNDNSGKPGGLEQAVKEHKVELFTSWFHKSNVYFIYDAEKLLKDLPKLIKGKRLISVPNHSYSSLGYAIDAFELLPYCVCRNVTDEQINNLKLDFKIKENKAKLRLHTLFQNLVKRA
jgi:hypothetical protein